MYLFLLLVSLINLREIVKKRNGNLREIVMTTSGNRSGKDMINRREMATEIEPKKNFFIPYFSPH